MGLRFLLKSGRMERVLLEVAGRVLVFELVTIASHLVPKLGLRLVARCLVDGWEDLVHRRAWGAIV